MPVTEQQDPLYSSIMQAKVAICVLVGPQHTFEFANHAYRALVGNRPLVGLTVLEALPELEGQTILGVLDQVFRSGETFEGREWALHLGQRKPDGPVELGYFDFVYEPRRTPEGHVDGIVVTVTDITHQVLARQAAEEQSQTAEAELKRQQDMTARIIENTPATIVFLDRDLIYRWNNPAHCRKWNLRPDEIIGRSVAEVVPGAEAIVGPIVKQVLDSGKPFTHTALEISKTGNEPTYWEITFMPIRGDHLHPEGVLIMATEVTERIQSERVKDQFLSVMSHELRTPLNFIMGFASTLEDEVQGPMNPAQLQAVGKILTGADRMLGLVNDLLEFSKIQSGSYEIYREPTAFCQLVDEVVDKVRPQAEYKGLQLTAEVDGALEASLDRSRIAQVLNNLIGNAIKFTRTGSVTVRAAHRDGQLVLEVQDTGVGIPADKLPTVFRRLHQVDMSATREAGGVGLGLAISLAIVEAHGGTLSVESEAGRGSTFRVALPV